MSIIHSVMHSLRTSNEEKFKTLLGFLDSDICSEMTFVYMKNSKIKSELIISSGEIKVYKGIRVDKDKNIIVEFSEPIKPYGQGPISKTFSVNILNPDSEFSVITK